MSRVTAVAAAFIILLTGLARPGSAADNVVLQLHGPAEFEFTGYYAARWKGYYHDAGLTVEIRPGGLHSQKPIDPVREVAEGRAQFGIGTMQLVIRAAQGLPLLLLAPIFQESGAAIYSRADSDFSSPAALVRARLGRLPASDILDIELTTALRAEGIDPGRIKAVSIDASQIVPALADHAIDAAIGSAWIVPWEAHERGVVLKSFNPASYRVAYYGDSLFTMRAFAAAEPDIVQRFRDASLRGWEYALQHPDEIAQRLVSDPPGPPPVGDAAGFARYQIDVARRLAHYPDVALGSSSPDRWTQIEAGMLGAGALGRTGDLRDFVYSPASASAREASGGGLDRLVAIILAAAAAIVATGWVGRRWWRRRSLAAGTIAPAFGIGAGAPPATEAAAADALPAASRRLRMSMSFFGTRLPQLDWTRFMRAPTAPLPAQEPPKPIPVDLNAILTPLERRIRQRVRGKVRFRFSLLPTLWPCRTEIGAVAAMVLDLVSTATAVMNADGSLIVGTRNITFDATNLNDYPDARPGEFARITVRDNGPALTATEFGEIFDWARSTRPAIATAADTMGRIGGFVRVETAEGIGTAVHLYFPRFTEPGSASADVEATAVRAAMAE